MGTNSCSTLVHVQFQTNFTPIQHLLFVGTVLLVNQYVTLFGYRLLARLDKRRRRRLARAAGVEDAYKMR